MTDPILEQIQAHATEFAMELTRVSRRKTICLVCDLGAKRHYYQHGSYVVWAETYDFIGMEGGAVFVVFRGILIDGVLQHVIQRSTCSTIDNAEKLTRGTFEHECVDTAGAEQADRTYIFG